MLSMLVRWLRMWVIVKSVSGSCCSFEVQEGPGPSPATSLDLPMPSMRTACNCCLLTVRVEREVALWGCDS